MRAEIDRACMGRRGLGVRSCRDGKSICSRDDDMRVDRCGVTLHEFRIKGLQGR